MKKFALKLTSAVVLDGGINRAGTIVHVDQATALNLLHRGKAEIATEADEPTQDDAQEQEAAAASAAAAEAAAAESEAQAQEAAPEAKKTTKKAR